MAEDTDTMEEAEFAALLDYLRGARGFDFGGYKTTSVRRRLRKRMEEVGVERYADYQDHLEVHPEEFPLLFDTLLINVTRFFRDPGTWEHLGREVVPKILADRDGEVRVWSAGCAGGQEAYSLAMLFAEALGIAEARERVRIYATDLDEGALVRARRATYADGEVESVPDDLRARYFTPQDGQWVVNQDLRRLVIFARHDLVQDAPISRVSLLTCRNTLMYLNAETQARVLGRLHFALRDDGLLVLGRAEMLLSHGHLFTPVELATRVFRKVPGTHLRGQLLALAQVDREPAPIGPRPEYELGLAVWEANPVAELVVDTEGRLQMANRRSGQLFGMRATDIGRYFQDLEVSYRPLELRPLLRQVVEQRSSVTVDEVARGDGDHLAWYLVTLTPVLVDDELLGISVTFRDITTAKRLQQELERAARELDGAYEELQSTYEELETTNEELQSTIEEQETTNEELQSTNEELETLNEELQASNLELHSINDELRMRTEQVDEVNAYLESILVSLRAGVLVVNSELVIRIWNERAEDLWGVRPDEVKGMHLLNLDIGLPVDRLRAPVRACLAGEVSAEPLLFDVTNRKGRTIHCRVRISPLRGADKTIQGAIVLMEEQPGESTA